MVGLTFDSPLVDKIGRPGQAQSGVDVYAARSTVGRVGVQCKRMDDLDENNQPLPGGPITRKILIDEVDKAMSFTPDLDLWILATTAKRDAHIQKIARQLEATHQQQGLFGVKLWFWDDYVTMLNNHTKLQKWYYADVIGLRDARDQDRLILETIATAFHRPALTDPLNIEQADDLLQALKDTQAALRTGKLVDRQTGHVVRQAVGGWRYLVDTAWQARAEAVDRRLSEVRKALIAGLADGRLERVGGMSVVKNPALGAELDQGRTGCWCSSTISWSWRRSRRSESSIYASHRQSYAPESCRSVNGSIPAISFSPRWSAIRWQLRRVRCSKAASRLAAPNSCQADMRPNYRRCEAPLLRLKAFAVRFPLTPKLLQ